MQDDYDAIAHWLQLGRTGTPVQQATARTELGLIFESRGLLDDAAEAYWVNVKARVSDPRPYYRLAAICRLHDDEVSAARILALVTVPARAPQNAPAPEEVGVSPTTRSHSRLPTFLLLGGSMVGLAGLLLVGIVLGVVAATAPVASSRAVATPQQSPQLAPVPPSQQVAVKAEPAPTVVPATREPAPRPHQAAQFTPTTNAALANLRVVPAQCYDADIRFRYAHDPRSAVTQAMLQNGINPFTTNPFTQMDRDKNSPKIVGGWIGVSLMREWRGYSPITLAAWMRMDRTYKFPLGGPDWEEITSWPATTCEGAFVQNPANLDIMRLVRSNVSTARASHSDPAPIPYQPKEQIRCDSSGRVRVDDLKWRIGSDGNLYVVATVTSLCDHSLYVAGDARITVNGQESTGLGMSGLKLMPRSTFTYPELKSDRVFTGVKSVRVVLEGLDCPEMVC